LGTAKAEKLSKQIDFTELKKIPVESTQTI